MCGPNFIEYKHISTYPATCVVAKASLLVEIAKGVRKGYVSW